MKIAIRLSLLVAALAGILALVRLSSENRDLAQQVAQLEAELGRMPIADSERVHIVEIESPDVPPEVALHLERVWQFRCYLPPGYDVVRSSGGGRIAKEGVYLAGGSSSGWGSPRPEPIHQLLTISFQKQNDRIEAFTTFGGSSSTSSWGEFAPSNFDDALVVQKLVSSEQGPRSFDQDTILPVLRVYDPSSAEDKQVAGKTITTYAGGLFLLCPKSRASALDQLERGETPPEFEPDWIATEATDE